MVIKVPVYMEFTEKLSPADVAEMTMVAQREFTKWVRARLTNDRIDLNEWKTPVHFTILSVDQVLNRLTKSSTDSRRNPATPDRK